MLQTPYRIAPSSTTPEVAFDPARGSLRLSGLSMPENVTAFYGPVLEWVREYAQAPAPYTQVTIDLAYFNTATSKVLLEFFGAMQDMADAGHDVGIRWYYNQSDLDMRDAAEDYAILLSTPVEVLPKDVDEGQTKS